MDARDIALRDHGRLVDQMPSPHALIVRLPSGTEYWYAEAVPEVGEIVRAFGKPYLVRSVEPAEDDRFVITLAEQELSTDTVAGSPLI